MRDPSEKRSPKPGELRVINIIHNEMKNDVKRMRSSREEANVNENLFSEMTFLTKNHLRKIKVEKVLQLIIMKEDSIHKNTNL